MHQNAIATRNREEGTIMPTLTQTPTEFVAESQEIVFVDSGIADLKTFLLGVRAGVEAVVLDPLTQAPGQIARVLRERDGVSAIHIVAHGSAGEVGFASGSLSLTKLPEHAA